MTEPTPIADAARADASRDPDDVAEAAVARLVGEVEAARIRREIDDAIGEDMKACDAAKRSAACVADGFNGLRALLPIDTTDVRERMIRNRHAIGGFTGRREEITGLYVGAIASANVLLVSKPGTAKTLTASVWCAQWFAVVQKELFTRQTVEQDILAYLDVPKFTRHGVYSYRYDGKLSTAHFAICDEIFKTSAGLLNALLSWINERDVRGGYKSPLVQAIGLSNEFGEDDTVAALEDRFLIRFEVQPLDDAGRKNMIDEAIAGAVPPTLERITLTELDAVRREATALPFEPGVSDALTKLVASCKGVDVYVSDRRIRACVGLLRAFAWLDGAHMVMLDHLDFLRNVLWGRPDEKPLIEAAISAVNRSVVGEIRQIVEQVVEAYQADKQRMTPQEFRDVAWPHAEKCLAASRQIKEKFAGSVPQYVKDRAQSYLRELGQTFEEAKAASKLGV
jgi:MoxR-like ATPase